MNNDLPLCLLIAAFSGALMLLMPHISPLRYFFAITVPPGFRSSAPGRASLRRYHGAVVCSVVITVLLILRVDQGWPNLSPVLAMLVPGILAVVAFLWERRQVARQALPVDSVREAELATDGDHLPRWFALVLLPAAFPVAAALWLRAHWDQIPQQVPIHWNIHNEVDRWVGKSVRAVYGPVLFAGGMTLVMIVLAVAMFYGSRRGRQRTAMLQIMVATICFLALLFSGIGVLAGAQASPLLILIPGLIFPLGLLVWIFLLQRDPRMPADPTPDACWYLGSIYVNSQDPAIFVQKRIGFGYTINMGNRLSWLIMGVFVAAIVGLMFVMPG